MQYRSSKKGHGPGRRPWHRLFSLLSALTVTTLLNSWPAAVIAQESPQQQPPAVPDKKDTATDPGTNTGAAEPATGKQGIANNPPDDYEASEQISEDLPVSFPVDI